MPAAPEEDVRMLDVRAHLDASYARGFPTGVDRLRSAGKKNKTQPNGVRVCTLAVRVQRAVTQARARTHPLNE